MPYPLLDNFVTGTPLNTGHNIYFRIVWTVYQANCNDNKLQQIQTNSEHEINVFHFYTLPNCRNNGTIFSFLLDHSCPSSCLGENITNYFNCWFVCPIFSILMGKVNKMLIDEPRVANHLQIYNELEGKGRMLPEKRILSFINPGTRVIISPVGNYVPVYCVRLVHFFPPNWFILVKPLQSSVWIAMIFIFSTVALLLLRDKNYWNFPMVFIQTWIYLMGGGAQFAGKRISNLKIMVGTMLLFGILINHYVSVVTSNFLSFPILQENKNLADLLIRGGYKLIVQSNIERLFFKFNSQSIESKVGIKNNFTLMIDKHFFILGNFTPWGEEYVAALADKKGFFFAKSILHGKSIQGTFTSGGKLRCFILGAGEAIEIELWLVFRYRFVRVVAQVERWVQEAGFYEVWYNRRNEYATDKVIKQGNISFSQPGYRPIPLDSHVKVIFYQAAIAAGGMIGIFLLELLSQEVAVWFIRSVVLVPLLGSMYLG